MEFLDKNGLQHMLESLKPHVGSTTPDWNANEEEKGYIKNRTHYIVVYNRSEVQFYEGGSTEFEVYAEPNKDLYAFASIDNLKTAVKVEAGAYLEAEIGPSLVVQNIVYAGGRFIISLGSPPTVDTKLYFANLEFYQLDSRFIPDDIARQEYVESLEEKIIQLEEKIANL